MATAAASGGWLDPEAHGLGQFRWSQRTDSGCAKRPKTLWEQRTRVRALTYSRLPVRAILPPDSSAGRAGAASTVGADEAGAGR